MDSDEAQPYLSPSAMAERCDTPIDTLRYYEREGLLEHIERTAGGQRRYSENDVAWVQILRCLRTTALPIRDMRRFAELVREGDSAIGARVELLAAHRVQVVEQLAAMNEALTMIDHKIEVYSEHLQSTPVADISQTASAPTLSGKGIRART